MKSEEDAIEREFQDWVKERERKQNDSRDRMSAAEARERMHDRWDAQAVADAIENKTRADAFQDSIGNKVYAPGLDATASFKERFPGRETAAHRAMKWSKLTNKKRGDPEMVEALANLDALRLSPSASEQ